MSNSLGTLSVHLEAMTAKFESDIGRAARVMQQQGEAIKRAAGEVGQVVAAGLVAASVATAALVKTSIDVGDSLNKMAQKVGISVESLSVLRQQATLSDVALESLQGGLVKMAKAAVAAAEGSKAQADAFKAVGVSVTDSTGKLKGSQQLFSELAVKFSGYTDSAGKAALATEFFGKSGADLIPLLNQLGAQGFEAAAKQAEQFGAIITTDAAKASEQFNDNLTMLHQALEGFGNQIVNQAIGPLAAYTGKMVEAATAGNGYASSASIVANAIKGIIFGAVLVTNTIEMATQAIIGLYVTTKTVLTTTAEAFIAWGVGVGKTIDSAMHFDIKGAAEAGAMMVHSIRQSMDTAAKDISAAWANAGDSIGDSLVDVQDAFALFDEAAKKAGESSAVAAAEAGKMDAPLIKNAESATKAQEATDKMAASQRKAAEHLSQLRGAADPVNAAYEKYTQTIIKNNAIAQEMIRNKVRMADVEEFLASASAAAVAELNKATTAIAKQRDILGTYLKQLGDDRKLLGLSEREKQIEIAVRQATAAWEANEAAHVGNQQSLAELTSAVRVHEGAMYDDTKAVDAAQASAERYASIVRGAMDSMIDATAEWAVNGFKNAKDYWKGMVDQVKRAVAQMLAEWAKTKIMRWLSGSGGSGGGGGFWTAIAGAAVSAMGGSSSSGGSVGGNGAGGTQRTGGFSYSGGNGGGGGGVNLGDYASLLGNTGWAYAGQFAASGAGTAAAAAAPWLGAIGGAWYGSTRGDGGAGTVGATAAGAIAGYYAGTVAASAITGAGAAYTGAVAAGATTATAGGAAAGGAAAGASAGLAAIPIIGWVAAIALIVDKVSGGKVFGTKYRPESVKETVSFGEQGPSAKAQMIEWRYQHQLSQAWNRVLTGGAVLPSDWGDKDRRVKDIPIDPAMLAALQKVFEAFAKTAKEAARQVETAVVGMIESTFETITTYDKKGKVKRTETVGTIDGKKYTEDWEQFQMRVHAELIIKTLMQINDAASATAEAYRANAEELIDAAGTMLQAQVDLKNNVGLLGGGADMTSVFKWVEEHRQGEEKLLETYARLAAGSAQYRDILERVDEATKALANSGSPVDQMRAALDGVQKNLDDNIEALNAAAVAAGLNATMQKDLAKVMDLSSAQIAKISKDFFASIDQQIAALSAVNTPSGDFAGAMRAIYAAMVDNIAQANMVARAAGQQGASEMQLAKIHELAARQAAAAIAKLVEIGKQQAQSLYGGIYSLADIDAAIAELQGRADAAATSVSSFGGAMSSAATQANDAINLLLGSLSPLNDQKKLQVALEGLYSGTVSQEQVLEIGRRLYASSQAYNDLFAQVSAVTPRHAGGGGGGPGSDTASQQGLSGAETARLAELIAKREEMLANQRHAEALELANTVAALAEAQGKSFFEVARDTLGFDLSRLGDDLDLNAEQLQAYLESIDVNQEAVTDSVSTGVDRIIAKLDQIFGSGVEVHSGGGGKINGPELLDGVRASSTASATASREAAADIVDAVEENTAAVRDLLYELRHASGANSSRSVDPRFREVTR